MELPNGMYAVEPKTDCPHVSECVKKEIEMSVERARALFADGKNGTCDVCEADENWVCASCEAVLCSRYQQEHMEQHFYETGLEHAIACSLSDLSTWCYKCNSYIVSPAIQELRSMLYIGKFGCIPPDTYRDLRGDLGIGDDTDDSDDSDEEKEEKSETPEEQSCNIKQLRDRKTAYPEPSPRALPDEIKNSASGGGVNGSLSNDSIREYEDSEPVLKAKINELASLLHNSNHCVVYTGAGISTRYLPDYRGPQGVWTMKDRGLQMKRQFDLKTSPPTEAHMALSSFVENNIVKCIVSTNVDSLHLKSGVPEDKLCELHGNCFKEECSVCGAIYVRDYTVRNSIPVKPNVKGMDHPRAHRHATGSICEKKDCQGVLMDNVIAFGEDLPEAPLQKAYDESNRGDLALVVGTSMRVQPACSLPVIIANKRNGKMVIINYQKTPYDSQAYLRIWADSEVVLPAVARILSSMPPKEESFVAKTYNYLTNLLN